MSYAGLHKQTFLSDFLTAPRFKIWRHILLIIGTLAISFNQVYSFFGEYLPEREDTHIYIITILVWVSYLIVAYYSLYVLIPKYLLTRKYGKYIILLLIAVVLRALSQSLLDYITLTIYNSVDLLIFDYSYLRDLISTFIMDGICITGVSATVFLKYWMIDSRRVSQLEKEQMQIEVEHLKEQIEPTSLFHILNRAGNLAKTDKDKASLMLLELSTVLRYQLYDANRENVLLNSEIEFIRNYLALQQLYYNGLEYTISVEGDSNMILTPPLLFVPFIRSAMNISFDMDVCRSISVIFRADEDTLVFVCNLQGDNFFDNSQLTDIKKRLNYLYSSDYELMAEDKTIRLRLNLK